MRSVSRLLMILLVMLAPVAWGQVVAPISGQVINQFGQPIPFAKVRICSVTSTNTPCTPTSPIFLDYNLSIPASNPYGTDQYGNYTVYVPALAPPNLYEVELVPASGITWTYVVKGPQSGGGTNLLLQHNSVNLANQGVLNFHDTIPAAPTGFTDVIFQTDSSGKLSGYVLTPPVVQVNGVPLITASPANFVNSASVTWSNPSAGVIQATAAGGGSSTCGPLSGDSTSTNCGNGNFTGTPPIEGQTFSQAFGYFNLDNSPFISEAVAIGSNNVVGSQGTSAPSSLAVAIGIGLTNVNNINTGAVIIGIGQDNANGVVSGGSHDITEIVAIGDGNAGKLGNFVDDVVAIGAAVHTIPDNSFDIVAIGDGADKQCANFTGCGSIPNPITTHGVVAIGGPAASFNQGSNIVAIGELAMGSNAAGAGVGFYNHSDYNIAIGFAALIANSTGANNVALGAFAGADGFVYPNTWANSNHTGSNNTWIGYDSGPNTTTQLSNTVALGFQAHNTQSNQTVIGNSSIASLIIFGCPTGQAVLDDGSGTCFVPGSGGSGGTNVSVNGGSTLTSANLSNTTPAPGAANINVAWQNTGSNVSAEVPFATGSAFGVIKPDGTSCTVAAGVLTCSGSGGGVTLQTNGVPNASQALLNFVNPTAFNGLNFAFLNSSGGIETFAVSGTLSNAGLANPATTVNSQTCTLGSTCTVPGTITSFTTTGTSGAATFSGGTLNIPNYATGGGSSVWSSLTNPVSNLALTMAANTTTFTFGATTGSADLFKWTDTTSNTGTGIMGHFTTASGSTEIPWQADANGVGWRIAADGSLASVGSSVAGGVRWGAGSAPGAAPTSTVQVYVPSSVTAYSLVLPGAQPTAGNNIFSCTAANPSICSFVAAGTATTVASEESVAFSTTPTFSTAFRESTITLTASITTFTLAAGTAGQEKTLTFCENGTGGFDVTPPANVHGFMNLSGGTETASKCNSQHYTYNSIQTAWIADSPGVLNQ